MPEDIKEKGYIFDMEKLENYKSKKFDIITPYPYFLRGNCIY